MCVKLRELHLPVLNRRGVKCRVDAWNGHGFCHQGEFVKVLSTMSPSGMSSELYNKCISDSGLSAVWGRYRFYLYSKLGGGLQ